MIRLSDRLLCLWEEEGSVIDIGRSVERRKLGYSDMDETPKDTGARSAGEARESEPMQPAPPVTRIGWCSAGNVSRSRRKGKKAGGGVRGR